MNFIIVNSPIGPIKISADESGIVSLIFTDGTPGSGKAENQHLVECMKQLDEYFTGLRKEFTVALNLKGTEFMQSVWNLLLKIPYGKTCTYGELAAKLGDPSLSRAVGLANGKNPVSIIVPCHRVIGSDGSMTGYAWGMEKKRWLLDFERGALTLGF